MKPPLQFLLARWVQPIRIRPVGPFRVGAAVFFLALSFGLAAEFLCTRGQDLVDEHGQRVLLRGVGLGNWLLPEGYMWHFGEAGDRPRKIEKLVTDLVGAETAARFWTEFRKNYITEADIARIAELGFNSVRPALNAGCFWPKATTPTSAKKVFSCSMTWWVGAANTGSMSSLICTRRPAGRPAPILTTAPTMSPHFSWISATKNG